MIEINDIILERDIAVHIVRGITVGAYTRTIEAPTSIKLTKKKITEYYQIFTNNIQKQIYKILF